MKKNKTKLLTYSTILLFSVTYIVFLSFIFHNDNKYKATGLQPINGVLCLSENDFSNTSIHFLKDQWQCYPDVTLTPTDFIGKTPSNYMYYMSIGESLTPNSSDSSWKTLTYRLQIFFPEKEHIYSLALPEIYDAYNLYVNDFLVAEMGNPSQEDFEKAIGNRTVSFSASGKTTLLFNISSQNPQKNGMLYLPSLGYPDAITHMQNLQLVTKLTVIIIILIFALFSLFFFIKTTKQSRTKHYSITDMLEQRTTLLYLLLCLCTIGCTIYPLLFTIFTVHSSLWYSFEMICTYSMYLLMILIQNHLLNKKKSYNKIIYILFGVLLCIVLLYSNQLLTFSPLRTVISIIMMFVSIIIALFLLISSLIALHKGEKHSVIIIFGTILFSISSIANYFVNPYEPIYGGWFREYGSIIFVIILGYVLWSDLISAYQFKLTFSEEKRQLTRQIDMQKTHYQTLNGKIEQAIRLRHDQRHHLRTLLVLLEDNKIDNAKKYIEEYIETKIDTERTVLSENLIIDAILLYYSKLCRDANIFFDTKMDLPANMNISDTDISILFSNLLENAYEACTKASARQNFIHVQGMLKGDALFLRIENNYEGQIKITPDAIVSTKHSGYGIGIRSVKSIVDQYHGVMSIEPDNHVFQISIIMNL